MAVLNHSHFDVHEYVKKAISFGIKEEFAEYSARQIERLSETIAEQRVEIDALKAKEPATKGDVHEVKQELKNTELKLQKEIEIVRKEIAESKTQVIIWVAGMFVASGILQHFFK